MADQEQIPPESESREEASEQGSVFGNLPGSRPGVRSPRRGAAGAAEQSGSTKGTGRQPRPAARKQRPAEPQPPRDPGGHPAESEGATPPTPPEHGGVEDLAWAGIAVAAEAATLGVRLLSRAVEAVRKPTDRR
jgi:hypothetical protein